MKRYALIGLFAIAASTLLAQDIHYSQFYNSPLNVNPANTGVFNGDKRLNLSYRRQWSSVPVPWTTFSGSYDRKFYPKKDKNHFFSGGILFNYDREGNITKLNLSNFNVTGSFTSILNENNLITLGALIGYSTRGFSLTGLTWDKQWDGTSFDPTIDPGENFQSRRVSFLDLGIGANYRWQKSKRTKVDLGVGLLHLQEPGVAFVSGDDISLPRRLTLSGVGSFKVASKIDLQLQALGQFQGESDEFVFGGLGKFYVSQRRGDEVEVHLGAGYRTSKSVFPILAIQYKQFYGAVSYDIDLSDFSDLHQRPAALELHFSYIIADVRPFKRAKVCPIF